MCDVWSPPPCPTVVPGPCAWHSWWNTARTTVVVPPMTLCSARRPVRPPRWSLAGCTRWSARPWNQRPVYLHYLDGILPTVHVAFTCMYAQQQVIIVIMLTLVTSLVCDSQYPPSNLLFRMSQNSRYASPSYNSVPAHSRRLFGDTSKHVSGFTWFELLALLSTITYILYMYSNTHIANIITRGHL